MTTMAEAGKAGITVELGGMCATLPHDFHRVGDTLAEVLDDLGVESGIDVSVRIDPAEAEVVAGETRSFLAVVEGTAETDVSWEASAGSFTGSGNTIEWTAPTLPGEYTLTATSVGITARVLKDIGRSQSNEARVILGAAVIDDVEVKKGLHSLFFRAGGDFDRIRLSGLDNGVSLCTNDITLGVPEPFKPQ